jgi:hypothetical protein
LAWPPVTRSGHVRSLNGRVSVFKSAASNASICVNQLFDQSADWLDDEARIHLEAQLSYRQQIYAAVRFYAQDITKNNCFK